MSQIGKEILHIKIDLPIQPGSLLPVESAMVTSLVPRFLPFSVEMRADYVNDLLCSSCGCFLGDFANQFRSVFCLLEICLLGRQDDSGGKGEKGEGREVQERSEGREK